MLLDMHGLLSLAFGGLLVSLLVLAVFRPDRIRYQDQYRRALFMVAAVLALQALAPLFLRADRLTGSAPGRSVSEPGPALGAVFGSYFEVWRVINLFGHVLVIAGLLLTVASVGLFGGRGEAEDDPGRTGDRPPPLPATSPEPGQLPR